MILLLEFSAVTYSPVLTILLTIRGFFRSNQKQYRKFSAAQAAA